MILKILMGFSKWNLIVDHLTSKFSKARAIKMWVTLNKPVLIHGYYQKVVKLLHSLMQKMLK